jgi:hypothetical protein
MPETPLPRRTSARCLLLAAALLGVAMQYPARVSWSAVALAGWLAAALWLDRPVLRRMWQPRFLAASAVLALMSGLLLGTKDARVLGIQVSVEGLAAGTVMMLRGVLLVGVGAWAARALTVGAERLGSRRPSGLTAAAGAAFTLVPDMRTRIRAAGNRPPAGRRRILGFEAAAVTLVCDASLLAETLARPDEGPPGGETGSTP